MAEGFLRSLDSELEVYSAGTEPALAVHRDALKVMAEKGIDISGNYPKDVAEFIEKNFDYLVTVCGAASESCPSFSGAVARRLHIGLDDPAGFEGSEIKVLEKFRAVRDEIIERFSEFYESIIRVSGEVL